MFQSYPARTQEYNGYKLTNKLSSDANAEKNIWRGKRTEDGKEVVLCFPKNKEAENALQRERRLLEHVGPHKNIIGLIALVENWGGQRDLWCLVLELVEPLGYDMFEAFYQQAILAGEKSVPLHQVKHYVYQIAEALEQLHSKGVLHRDMKVDNVLITGMHQVKLIDFGMATGPDGMSAGSFQARYTAPELATSMGDTPADLYGIGVIIFSLCSGTMPLTKDFEQHSKKGTLSQYLESRNVKGEAQIAAVNLLHHDPAQRWTIPQVKDWAEGSAAPMSRSSTNTTNHFQRWSNKFGEVPHVFGLNVNDNALHGKSIGELDLSAVSGMLVLLVIRNTLQNRDPKDIISVPNPTTVLQRNDWLCFGVGADESIDVQEQRKLLTTVLKVPPSEDSLDTAVERCAKDANYKGLYPFLPEFDLIALPGHCANAILGPESFAEEGQNALNVRSVFGINLAGVRRADGSIKWFPGAKFQLKEGDGGLIIRVPPPGKGAWENFMPSITTEQVENLVDIDKFKTTLNLGDEAFQKWMKNALPC